MARAMQHRVHGRRPAADTFLDDDFTFATRDGLVVRLEPARMAL
jgi:hypothetical protein